MPQIHTQAGNFSDFIKTGVDPRTGQFTLALGLPLPPANQLCGPLLSPTLTFTTLGSAVDRGFGLGWSLGLSEINLDQHAPSVRLSSGEQFAIDLRRSNFDPGGSLLLPDQKLQSVQVYCTNDGGFQLNLKTGECEILRAVDSNSSRYLLSELWSPEGRRLFVDWLPHGDGDFILERIRDESRVLLQLEIANNELAFIQNPDTEQASRLCLRLSNGRLNEICLPGIAAPFLIDYDEFPLDRGSALLLPRTFTGPLGATDLVLWETGNDGDGHRLPEGAPFPVLPRVARWIHSAGAQASELQLSYQWIGERNFLGYGSDQAFDWQQGRDNLYQVESDYQYEVVETRSDGQGTSLGSISRTWNRFHLQIREVQRQGQCEVRKETLYAIDPALSWEAQPAYCQLPHELLTTYLDHGRDAASRSERTRYRYDDFGNVLHVHYPSGAQEHYEYYPAEGAEGCPADALAMVRYLKKKTATPADAPGKAPVLATLYTYETLPSLLENAPAKALVVSETGLDSATGRVFETTTQSYLTTPGASYGREHTAITTLNGKATTTLHQYEINADELITSTTTIGFENDDENRSTHHSGQLLLTGHTAWERSQAGACTRYEYDELGRIRRTVIAADSPYQAERLAHYHLADNFARQLIEGNPRNPLMIEQVDVSGCRQRQWLDGEGRPVSVEREDLDKQPGVFREISRTQYDCQGRPVSQSSIDWLDLKPLVLTATTHYDDWGKAALTVSPEGVERHVRYDPVTLRSEQWLSAGGLPGAKQVILRNVAGSPVEQQDYDSDGHLLRTLVLVRDGLDRVIEKRIKVADTPDIVTATRYDHYSRVIEQRLPDDTVISWTYAAHSDDHHPASIAVTEATAQAQA